MLSLQVADKTADRHRPTECRNGTDGKDLRKEALGLTAVRLAFQKPVFNAQR